jgi:ribosomal protein L9
MKLYCFAVMDGFHRPPIMYLVSRKYATNTEKKRIKTFKQQVKKKKHE